MKLDDNVKVSTKKRSEFDLSFDGVLSQNWGDIVPIVCKEMVPGDTFQCDASVFTRLTPLASPTYGRIHGFINYFFVPNRIFFSNNEWEDFIRAGVDGQSDLVLPYFRAGNLASVHSQLYALSPFKAKQMRKLFTYLGLADPANYNTGSLFRLSMLPFAAYNRIYGDYYFPWDVEDDADAENIYFRKLEEGRHVGIPEEFPNWFEYFTCKSACFKKDYLTTAQTRPQRGQQMIATLTGEGDYDSGQHTPIDPDNTHVGSDPVGITSLAMRWANSIQRFLEKNNVAGARYFEQILARFGVSIPAERLDRSEYIGGSDFWINVSDVTSTSQSPVDSNYAPLGAQAGKGIGLGQRGITYTSKDYGFFMALVHFVPESGCPQGLDKMWTRSNRFDYFTPELEDTGSQPIYNVETWQEFVTSKEANKSIENPFSSGVFGYIPRYAEYKFSKPLLAGDFRLDDGIRVDGFGDMDSMHLYRLFNLTSSDIPVLNTSFNLVNDYKQREFNRIFQDTNTDFDHFWTNIQVKLRAIRPMIGYLEGSAPFTGSENGPSVTIPAFGTRL